MIDRQGFFEGVKMLNVSPKQAMLQRMNQDEFGDEDDDRHIQLTRIDL